MALNFGNLFGGGFNIMGPNPNCYDAQGNYICEEDTTDWQVNCPDGTAPHPEYGCAGPPDPTEEEYTTSEPIWQLPFAQGSGMDYGVEDYNNDGYINMADLEYQNVIQTSHGNMLAEQAAQQAAIDQANFQNQIDTNWFNNLLGGGFNQMLGGGILSGGLGGGGTGRGLNIDTGGMTIGSDFNMLTGQCTDPWKTFIPGQGCVDTGGGESTITNPPGEGDETSMCGPGFKRCNDNCIPAGAPCDEGLIDDPPIACGQDQRWDPFLNQCIDIGGTEIDEDTYKDDWRKRQIGGGGDPVGPDDYTNPVTTQGYQGGIGPSVEAPIMRNELESMITPRSRRPSWGRSRWGGGY